QEGTPSLAQAGIRKDRRELAFAESKLPCPPHAPGKLLARLAIPPISSPDSLSGCRPLGPFTLGNETLPFHRAARCGLARCPASSPSSISTSRAKRSSSNFSCASERLTPSKATTLR